MGVAEWGTDRQCTASYVHDARASTTRTANEPSTSLPLRALRPYVLHVWRMA